MLIFWLQLQLEYASTQTQTTGQFVTEVSQVNNKKIVWANIIA